MTSEINLGHILDAIRQRHRQNEIFSVYYQPLYTTNKRVSMMLLYDALEQKLKCIAEHLNTYTGRL